MKEDLSFAVIDGRTVHEIIFGNMTACVDIVRECYVLHGNGKTINPNSYFLKFPEQPQNRIIALPAHISDVLSVSGIKWISSFPKNIQHGLPRASAVLILNSATTGYPFACMEASIISAARTAASAALAAQVISGKTREEKSNIAIIGNGLIARYTLQFLRCVGFHFNQVILYDAAEGESRRFAERNKLSSHETKIASSHNEAIEDADVVVYTTVASEPHVSDPKLFRAGQIILNISLRDLAPAIILASNNIVDDIGHVLNAGTSVHLTEQQVGHHQFINGTLPQLLAGDCALNPDLPTIFSPFGLGVLDLAVGLHVYRSAVDLGLQNNIPNFFFDLVR